MVVLIALLALLAAVAIVRAHGAWRVERAVAARLRTGPDGIVDGAHPIECPGADDRAVLMLHGFGDTPQTFAYLAAHLHAQGWAVRAPLLPGHGRTLRSFRLSRADDWIACARAELAATRARYPMVALAGLSMGGALATILAAEEPDLVAVVLLAPYLSMPARMQRIARAHRAFGALTVYFRGRGEQSIRDPTEMARSLAYGFTTPRLLHELALVVEWARASAPAVMAPTLMIQSRQDGRISPEAAQQTFALFDAPERRLVWTEGNGHIITVDHGRQRVLDLVSDWLTTRSVRRPLPSSLPHHHGPTSGVTGPDGTPVGASE